MNTSNVGDSPQSEARKAAGSYDAPFRTARLKRLAEELRQLTCSKADKLMILVSILYQLDSETFRKLDNLTWPAGMAILLASNRRAIERTNQSAQIKEIPKSEYFIDAGHDNAAMRRLVEIMMRRLGYEPGIISQLKGLFEVRKEVLYGV